MTDYYKNKDKIVVLGSGAVGKSALTIRLTYGDFLDYYDPTIEQNHLTTVTVDDQPAHLDILDTAGQDQFLQMQDEWIREGKGVLVVYAIDNLTSFTHLEGYKEKIDRVKDSEPYALVLVGNKCDLENWREVTTEEGKALAKEWGCPFYETSAKTKINHKECFFHIVRQLREINERERIEEEEKLKKKKKRFPCVIL